MRFNSKAYNELYPRKVETENVETVISTFTPTTDKLEDTDVADDNVDVTVDAEGGDDNGREPDSGLDNE